MSKASSLLQNQIQKKKKTCRTRISLVTEIKQTNEATKPKSAETDVGEGQESLQTITDFFLLFFKCFFISPICVFMCTCVCECKETCTHFLNSPPNPHPSHEDHQTKTRHAHQTRYTTGRGKELWGGDRQPRRKSPNRRAGGERELWRNTYAILYKHSFMYVYTPERGKQLWTSQDRPHRLTACTRVNKLGAGTQDCHAGRPVAADFRAA